MTSQAKNPNLSIYCQPIHSATVHVAHCLLQCHYKNRCRDFVRHYMSHQVEIDEAARVFQSIRDKDARQAMLNDIAVKQKPIDPTLARPAVKTNARPGDRLPQITPPQREKTSSAKAKIVKQPELAAPVKQPGSAAPPKQVERAQLKKPKVAPLKAIASAAVNSKVEAKSINKRKAQRISPAMAKEQKDLTEVFIILEPGGKALFFDDEKRILDYVVKSKRKARYFRATELEVQLKMVPVLDKPKAATKKPAKKRASKANAEEQS